MKQLRSIAANVFEIACNVRISLSYHKNNGGFSKLPWPDTPFICRFNNIRSVINYMIAELLSISIINVAVILIKIRFFYFWRISINNSGVNDAAACIALLPVKNEVPKLPSFSPISSKIVAWKSL